MAGGSGFYVDALVNGLDDFPSADLQLRNELMLRLKEEGVDNLRMELKALDPESYATIDIANGQRVVRALEVCLVSGKKYSELRKSERKSRDFQIVKVGITMPREELYERINRRVDMMIEEGLEAEARAMFPQRHLNALQTVGFSELFDYFDGTCSRDEAVELIKRNSRRYAKRQMTWFRRDKDIRWFTKPNAEEVIEYLETK